MCVCASAPPFVLSPGGGGRRNGRGKGRGSGAGADGDVRSVPYPFRQHNCVRYAYPVSDDAACKEEVCRRAHFNYFEWWPKDVCYCCKIFDDDGKGEEGKRLPPILGRGGGGRGGEKEGKQ